MFAGVAVVSSAVMSTGVVAVSSAVMFAGVVAVSSAVVFAGMVVVPALDSGLRKTEPHVVVPMQGAVVSSEVAGSGSDGCEYSNEGDLDEHLKYKILIPH